jgi:type IV pilus assembly protein PilA
MPRRARDEQGFTLIELLVVILIIGVLAAIAIPSFLNQKTKGYDASAKELARTGQTTTETIATDNGGSYASINNNPTALAVYEPSIQTTAAAGNNAYVVSSAGTATPNATFAITAKAFNTGDQFEVIRAGDGTITRLCGPPSWTPVAAPASGRATATATGVVGGCVNGSW